MKRSPSEVRRSPVTESARPPILRRSCCVLSPSCRAVARCSRSEDASPSLVQASPHEAPTSASVLGRLPRDLAADAADAAPSREILPRSGATAEASPVNVERSC